jgi:hypothetical protein
MDIVLIPGFMLDADLWTDLRPDLARFGRLVDGDTTQDTSIAGMATRILASMTGPAMVIGFPWAVMSPAKSFIRPRTRWRTGADRNFVTGG